MGSPKGDDQSLQNGRLPLLTGAISRSGMNAIKIGAVSPKIEALQAGPAYIPIAQYLPLYVRASSR